jgi:hypothetical protein
MTSSMTSGFSLTASLDLVEVKPGVKFSLAMLKAMLPDVETALFFGKLYELDYRQLSTLLSMVVQSDLADVLFAESEVHSDELQDYIVDICEVAGVEYGAVTFGEAPPHGEILPAVWESMRVEIADSIRVVAEKLKDTVGLLPGKQGQMVFSSMMMLNARRPVLGDYRAQIHHEPVKENLVVLDVSGSMSEPTVRMIIDDVVALSYAANAHMAVVSNTCSFWVPGSYSVDDVLDRCEFSGTQYETLADLFQQDWGTVICVADYDSSADAKRYLRVNCKGRIELVLDISLVNRPTFLAQCVGQLADEVRPLLVSNSRYVLAQ